MRVSAVLPALRQSMSSRQRLCLWLILAAALTLLLILLVLFATIVFPFRDATIHGLIGRFGLEGGDSSPEGRALRLIRAGPTLWRAARRPNASVELRRSVVMWTYLFANRCDQRTVDYLVETFRDPEEDGHVRFAAFYSLLCSVPSGGVVQRRLLYELLSGRWAEGIGHAARLFPEAAFPRSAKIAGLALLLARLHPDLLPLQADTELEAVREEVSRMLSAWQTEGRQPPTVEGARQPDWGAAAVAAEQEGNTVQAFGRFVSAGFEYHHDRSHGYLLTREQVKAGRDRVMQQIQDMPISDLREMLSEMAKPYLLTVSQEALVDFQGDARHRGERFQCETVAEALRLCEAVRSNSSE